MKTENLPTEINVSREFLLKGNKIKLTTKFNILEKVKAYKRLIPTTYVPYTVYYLKEANTKNVFLAGNSHFVTFIFLFI